MSSTRCKELGEKNFILNFVEYYGTIQRGLQYKNRRILDDKYF